MNARNLCATVEARPIYETARCTVRHRKASYCYGSWWSYYHLWNDHAGGIQGGACEKCGRTLKQVRVRINPKTASALGRAIAMTPADVPPIHFTGHVTHGHTPASDLIAPGLS